MQIRKTFFKSSLSLFSAFLFFSVISSPCQAFLVVPTSAPQARRNLVNIAYNSDKDEFLVVWRDKRNEADNLWDQVTDYGYETDGDIYGRIVKADGTMVTDEFVIIADRLIDESNPYAVYNSIKKEFVVFVQKMDKRVISKYDIHTTYCYNITAYRISSAGVRLGGEHIVSEAMGCQWYPRVVYNPDKNTFLVAYHDFRNFANYEKAIFARIVGYDTSGNLTNISDDFFLTRTIGNTTTEAYNYQQYSHVAYNSNLKQFFAVWGDDRKNPYITAWNHSYDIFGQILNSDGSFSGENKEIYSAPLNQHFPVIAFNNFTNQYLLTFLSDASQSADGNEVYFGPGYFARLDQNGNLISQPVKVEEETNEIFNPNISCSNNGSCLVAWSTSWNKGNRVMGRKITKTGILGKVIDLTDNISYPESTPWIAYRSNPIGGGTTGYLIVYDVTQLGSYSNINALFIDDQEEIIPTPIPTIGNKITEVGGIGQAHALWEGSPYTANNSVKTGYSASAPYDLSTGDVWAAVEPNEGVYNFSQQRKDVDLAKKYNKKIWLQIQTSANQNKEFNVPKWARDKGVETVGTNCGNGKTRIKYNLIKDLLKNPNYYDSNEYYISEDKTTVYVTVKIAAVWDPKYRYYFTNLLRALKKEFQEELDSGIIEAIGFMSGGNFGELTFNADKPYWTTDGVMDAINPNCPVVQSMARVFNKPVTEITAGSLCNTNYDYKTRSFEEVKVCPNGKACKIDYDSFCYVSDDYFIQSVMDLMTSYLEIFEKTPIVFQDGAGITGQKRASKVIKKWANTNFGSRVWFKFNGWGPQNSYFQNFNFNEFGNTTRHGYEPGEPYYFSRDNWRSSCAVDSNNKPICTLPNQTNNNCAANSNPPCCTAVQLKPCDDKGKQAISQTVEKGISGDRSSFLVMQSVFYNPAIERGNGIKSNEYYFNPEDTAVASVCHNSEIANWCPGYLNYIFSSQTANPFSSLDLVKQTLNLKKGANNLFNPFLGSAQISTNCVRSNKTVDHFWKTASLDSGLFENNFIYKNYLNCY